MKAMKKVLKQHTVITLYDEDENIVDQIHTERTLRGKEAEGIKPGIETGTYILPPHEYLS